MKGIVLAGGSGTPENCGFTRSTKTRRNRLSADHGKKFYGHGSFLEKTPYKKEHSLRNSFAARILHLSLPPFHCLQS